VLRREGAPLAPSSFLARACRDELLPVFIGEMLPMLVTPLGSVNLMSRRPFIQVAAHDSRFGCFELARESVLDSLDFSFVSETSCRAAVLLH